MKLVLLTPGTGSFLCGSCLRDNMLARALREAGHDVVLAPLYLPFATEEGAHTAPLGLEDVHMGGINVYLQQVLPWTRKLPRFLLKRLDSPRLLRWASHRAGMTEPSELGEMTLSMLRGESGRQAGEIERLCDWLGSLDAPEAVILSNVMLIGLARRLKETAHLPILCTLQGEAPFLDALPPEDSRRAWELLRERATDIDAFVAVSRYTGELMRERLAAPADRIHVIPNGIELDDFAPTLAPPPTPTIGYLARLCADKGLPELVEAYLALRERGSVPGVRLHLGGLALPIDQPLLATLRERIRSAGAEADVEWRIDLSRDEKVRFLQGLSVLSVPAAYGESFGLYLLEALACGVPVVQPRIAAFPEIVEATGGGLLYDPETSSEDEGGYVRALETLLLDPARAAALGVAGREVVLSRFTAARMARDVAGLCEEVATNAKR